MSRSRKKAIVKDNGSKKIYWKTIRRVVKNTIKKFSNDKTYLVNRDLDYMDLDELEEYVEVYKDEKVLDDIIPSPKEIVNDYTYCDHTIDYEHEKWSNDEHRIKNRRK